MLNHIKRLFGIKPTEAKAEVTQSVASYKVESPALAVPMQPVVEVVVEPTPVVVEPAPKVKKPAVKKPSAKKTTK